MSSGFLGYDSSFMLDFVVVALVLIVPLLAISLFQVKVRRNYAGHKRMQLGLAALLLVAVILFEVDVQWSHGGWENIINKPGKPVRMSEAELASVQRVLWIHLVFAVTTPIVWGITLGYGLRRFASPPTPGPHSQLHRRLGWLSVTDLVLTAVTGLWFYYVAFVA